MKRKIGVIGQKINMGCDGQVVKPQEPTSLSVTFLELENILTDHG